jgi:HPt (histidine-containing phosphotransfer) domain-containing protein
MRGDALRLGQVLLNFAGNAVKFTERSYIRVAARQVMDGDAGLQVRFEVIDSSIGMDAEQVERLFQAFEQADTSTTRKYGGSGLGLVISQRLIMLMGGDGIFVDSQPGLGSRFWFRIPLLAGLEQAAETVQPIDVRAALARRRGARILLAEDNMANQEVALALLEEASLRADVAANGTDALSDSLAGIPGLDAIAGLKSLRGNQAGYLRLLRIYLENHLNDMAVLRGRLAAEDRREAIRIAHSLKGASGAVGAQLVADLAAELESLLRAGADATAIENLAARLESALSRLGQHLGVVLGEEEKNIVATDRDNRSITQLLDSLEQLLRNDDMRTGVALQAAYPRLSALLPVELLAIWVRQISNYQFEDALESLAVVRRFLNASIVEGESDETR